MKLFLVVSTNEHSSSGPDAGTGSEGVYRVLTGIATRELEADKLIHRDHQEVLSLNNKNPLRNPLVAVSELVYKLTLREVDSETSSTSELTWEIIEIESDQLLNFQL